VKEAKETGSEDNNEMREAKETGSQDNNEMEEEKETESKENNETKENESPEKKPQTGEKFSAAAYKDNMDVVSREDLKSVFEKFGTVKVVGFPLPSASRAFCLVYLRFGSCLI